MWQRLVLVICVTMTTSTLADNVVSMTRNIKKRDMNVFNDICLKENDKNKGSLPDWMFQYASLHGLAKNKRMTAKFDSELFHKLQKIFKFPLRLVKIVDMKKTCTKYDVAIDKRHSTFDRGFVDFIQGADPVLLPNAHLQSWFYFYNCVRPLRQEFTFVDTLAAEAKKVLDAAEAHARSNKHVPANEKATFVGLVVQREYGAVDYQGNSVVMPTAQYYQKAMNFFEVNYANVIYMVYTVMVYAPKDEAWARKNFEGGPFVFMDSKSEELVLAVLGQCNHMILSPGPLSFWAAFISNGETVYYKMSQETEDTQHFSYHKMDYYLPYWRPME